MTTYFNLVPEAQETLTNLAVLHAGQNHFSPDVTLDDNLKEVWGMDSLDAIEIIMEVEAELDISLDEEKVGEYATLRELAERVRKMVGVKGD
jgi:acyl carrier protein